MKKSFFKCIALAAVGSFCVAGSALALPIITGGLSMTGTFTPVDDNDVAITIPTSTGLDFGGYIFGVGDNTFQVTTRTGSFVSLAPGSIGTINNFHFNPFSGSVAPLWSVGEFSFDMTSLSYGKETIVDSRGTSSYGARLVMLCIFFSVCFSSLLL